MTYRTPTRLSAATFLFRLADEHRDNAWRLAMGAMVSAFLAYCAARQECEVATSVLCAVVTVFCGYAWLEFANATACRKRGDEVLTAKGCGE